MSYIFSQVVDKPSGIMYHGSTGVTFHEASDEECVISAVAHLLSELEPESNILVEAFYAPVNPSPGILIL